MPLGIATAQPAAYLAKDGQALFAHKVRFIEVRGNIAGVSSTVQLDLNDLAKTTGRVVVPVKNLKTGIQLRDDHAKQKNALYTSQFPNATFQLQRLTGGKLIEGQELKTTAQGLLMIKGISKQVSIPVKALLDNGQVKIKTQFKFNPHVFKVNYPGSLNQATVNLSFILKKVQAQP